MQTYGRTQHMHRRLVMFIFYTTVVPISISNKENLWNQPALEASLFKNCYLPILLTILRGHQEQCAIYTSADFQQWVSCNYTIGTKRSDLRLTDQGGPCIPYFNNL